MEWLDQGQTIQRYRIEAWQKDAWVPVVGGYAIGHKKIGHFPAVTRVPTLPPNERTEKIVQKGVLFFVVAKRAVSRPCLPRNPPQSHHDCTTKIHQYFQNTP
jgi:hypothetical protein